MGGGIRLAPYHLLPWWCNKKKKKKEKLARKVETFYKRKRRERRFELSQSNFLIRFDGLLGLFSSWVVVVAVLFRVYSRRIMSECFFERECAIAERINIGCKWVSVAINLIQYRHIPRCWFIILLGPTTAGIPVSFFLPGDLPWFSPDFLFCFFLRLYKVSDGIGCVYRQTFNGCALFHLPIKNCSSLLLLLLLMMLGSTHPVGRGRWAPLFSRFFFPTVQKEKKQSYRSAIVHPRSCRCFLAAPTFWYIETKK